MAVSPETRRGRWVPRIKYPYQKRKVKFVKKHKRKGQARKLLRSCPNFFTTVIVLQQAKDPLHIVQQ